MVSRDVDGAAEVRVVVDDVDGWLSGGLVWGLTIVNSVGSDVVEEDVDADGGTEDGCRS